MRIGLAQLNTTVGDLEGNARRILSAAASAKSAGCELLVTPELASCGYPPQDLLLKPHFVAEQLRVLHETILPALPIAALIGYVDQADDGFKEDQIRGSLHNAALLAGPGIKVQKVRKTLLPTYDVFDEWRYFAPGHCGENQPLDFRGLRLGVTICEDLWDEGYACKVAPQLKAAGAQILINLSSSPYHYRKGEIRHALMRRHALQSQLPLLYCNLVGAQDELIFDGQSLCYGADGELVAQGAQFAEDLLVLDWDESSGALSLVSTAEQPAALQGADEDPEGMSELFSALCLGIRDYFQKVGFSKAVLGLSGGIDSALCACLAAEALGREAVIGVGMPSSFNAGYSLDDARELAANLGIEFHVLPIEQSVQLAMARFRAEFGEYHEAVTVENLQARERGKILMEISNDRRALVISTGNKTEYALGYTTLYGDMCGGLAVLGDVAKPAVYALSYWYNEHRRLRGGPENCIPQRSLTRPPSAELRSGQVDPFDYSRISPLTDLVVEEHLSRSELLERGYTAEEVDRVLLLVRISEYKRWQAPPILRVTEKAFGIGRRMPLVNKYKE
ncbi:NAD+ synthase [bacterium]|nr:NAD+ synthase [bacterium]